MLTSRSWKLHQIMKIDGECFFQIADDNELIDCLFPYSIDDGSGVPIEPLESYLNVPDKMKNPLSMENIKCIKTNAKRYSN